MRLAGDSTGASNCLTRSSLQRRERRLKRVSPGKVSVSTARVPPGRFLPKVFLLVINHLDDLSSETRACQISPQVALLSKGKTCNLNAA